MTDIPAGYTSGFQTSAWSVEALVDLIVAVGASNEFDGATITNSDIDSSVIGADTPAAASFTTVSASSTATLAAVNASGTLTANGILTAANSVTLSPASHNVVLSPTGTGVVTVNPATAGTMDNVALGVSTPLAVHATTLGATGAVTLSPANAAVVLSPTGSGVVTIAPATLGTLDRMTVGGTVAAAGTFTTLIGTTISATTLKTATHTPSSASDTGVAGTIAWDASFLYVCSATNTWLRVAIATW